MLLPKSRSAITFVLTRFSNQAPEPTAESANASSLPCAPNRSAASDEWGSSGPQQRGLFEHGAGETALKVTETKNVIEVKPLEPWQENRGQPAGAGRRGSYGQELGLELAQLKPVFVRSDSHSASDHRFWPVADGKKRGVDGDVKRWE